MAAVINKGVAVSSALAFAMAQPGFGVAFARAMATAFAAKRCGSCSPRVLRPVQPRGLSRHRTVWAGARLTRCSTRPG